MPIIIFCVVVDDDFSLKISVVDAIVEMLSTKSTEEEDATEKMLIISPIKIANIDLKKSIGFIF